MTERIDPNATIRQPLETGGRQVASEVRGSFRGEAVALAPNPISMIQDAAEELTFEVGAKLAEKELNEREITAKHEDGREKLVKKIEEYLEKIPDMDGDRLNRLLQDLRHNPPSSAEQLMDLVGEFYGDSSQQFVALEFLESELGDDETTLREITETARNQHLEEKSSEITAGLNVSTAAVQFGGKQVHDVQEFRDLYRQSVLGRERLSDTYGAILRQYGVEGFPNAIAFLIRAVGDDLGAASSSIDRVALKGLRDNIYELESLNTIHERSETTLNDMRGFFGIPQRKAATDLMNGLLPAMNESWANSEKITSLASDMEVQSNSEAEMYFLREVTEIVRSMPLKIFAEPKNRSDLLDASQDALDEAIWRWESEEEEE